MSDDFVELIGNMGAGFGLSKVACQLYGLLFMKGKPVSLDEMADELGISKGSASVNIRILERWEAVSKVWKKGSRKDYYRAQENIPEIVLKRMNEGLGRRLMLLKDYTVNAKGVSSKKQLKKLEDYIEKAEQMLKLLQNDNFKMFLR